MTNKDAADLIAEIQEDLKKVAARLQEIADHVGEWDDQEVRDEIERIVVEMEQ